MCYLKLQIHQIVSYPVPCCLVALQSMLSQFLNSRHRTQNNMEPASWCCRQVTSRPVRLSCGRQTWENRPNMSIFLAFYRVSLLLPSVLPQLPVVKTRVFKILFSVCCSLLKSTLKMSSKKNEIKKDREHKLLSFVGFDRHKIASLEVLSHSQGPALSFPTPAPGICGVSLPLPRPGPLASLCPRRLTLCVRALLARTEPPPERARRWGWVGMLLAHGGAALREAGPMERSCAARWRFSRQEGSPL